MKCMYYLAPNLVSTRQIADDLQRAGVDDWFLHIISKDEAGLKRDKLHSSNWLETTDLLRNGFLGANFGLIVGAILAGLLILFQPFGPNIPNITLLLLGLVSTLFGAWVGGLIGLDSMNRKLHRFHDEIEGGQYLLLIYARKGQGGLVTKIMSENHPESRHVATDRNFFNPFSQVERERRVQKAERAFD